MDLSVLRKRSKLSVDSFRLIHTFSDTVVDIRGISDFNKATEVIINGEEVTSFAVLSDSRILATPTVEVESIESVEVLADAYLENQTKFVEVNLGSRATSVEGIDKVIQKVIKVLLTTPGTDSRNLNLGGGLNAYIGQALNPVEVPSDIATSIRITEEQIIGSESEANLPDRDKLSSIKILSISMADSTSLRLNLEIKNKLGDTGSTEVSL